MKRIALGLAGVAVVAAVAVLVSPWHGGPTHANPGKYFVNDDGLPPVKGCDNPDFLTDDIETAIDHVSVGSGDTLIICEGTYVGPITVDKSLTITGRGDAEREDVRIEGDPASFADGFIIEADNVTIRHLTVDGLAGANTGIRVTGGAPPSYQGITISDVEVTDWGEGIMTNDAEDMVIEEAYVHGNPDGGILMEGGARNVVRNSRVEGNRVAGGLSVRDEDELLVEDNTLSGNEDAQIHMFGRVNVRIVRNEIVNKAWSKGIWLGAGIPAEAFVQIGGSPENANSFSGPFSDPDHYVLHSCNAQNTVDATYNWWGSANPIDIANRIFNDEYDDGTECGDPLHVTGAVVFHPWATAALTPTPTPTASPTATATPTVTATATATATPTGATRDLDLELGWNNFVWTGADGTAAAEALSCIGEDLGIAYMWGGSTVGFLRYVPGREEITNLETADKYDALLALVTAATQCEGMPVVP